jgi:hypothetical protein
VIAGCDFVQIHSFLTFAIVSEEYNSRGIELFNADYEVSGSSGSVSP